MVEPRQPTRRTLDKRDAITGAATRLFLERGYGGTSMDDLAGAAGVSKMTLYKQFGDKQSLFSAIVLDVTARAEAITTSIAEALEGVHRVADLEPALVEVAVAYAGGVVSPEVVRLRRLVIAEAERFPALADGYFERGPSQALRALATGFRRLDRDGLLLVDDADVAATQYAYLVLGPLLDRALFRPGRRIPRAQVAAHAQASVATFLARYQAKVSRRTIPSSPRVK